MLLGQVYSENSAHCCQLIVDGHSSHFSWELLEFAKANNIIVLCLPANTTHVLQSMFHSELTGTVSNKLSSLGCHWVCSVQAKIQEPDGGACIKLWPNQQRRVFGSNQRSIH